MALNNVQYFTEIQYVKRLSSFEEKRQSLRFPIDLPATCVRVNTTQQVDARLVDISTTGLRFRLAAELAIGTVIDVEFTPDKLGRTHSVFVRARVVRLVGSYDPVYEYGLRVLDDRRMLADLRNAVLSINLALSRRSTLSPKLSDALVPHPGR